MVTNISTSVKRIGRKRTEKIADVVIGWCKTNMGVNRRRKSPISHFCIKGSKGPDGKTTFGWYDHEDNIIGINYTMHKTLGDLIQTIIHEYVQLKLGILHTTIIILVLNKMKKFSKIS
jgi:hypothetical protein